QAFEQALFFLNMEAQPSNEELPHLILPKFTYKPPNGAADKPHEAAARGRECRLDPLVGLWLAPLAAA
ncbi:MAG: hypothetical protein KKA73_11190, partial [Chloroflexi bacterium]|nr:hypothetical protein [Chloroflexota bacterium]